MMRPQKILPVLILITLAALYALFLAHPINLATADLGRHLQNGKELWQNHELIRSNFYSYTYPDFSVTNHHWGSGLLFYLAFQAAGFVGAHILFITVALLAFLIFFQIARKRGGLLSATLLSILTFPLLAERAEVRPEIFSYLFAGIFFWILLAVRKGDIKTQWLWCLPFIEILWINSHIYFFLGLAISGAFLAESAIKKQWAWFKKFTVLLAALIAATLINPFGLKGILAPLVIFRNYGYRLAENQTLWSIEKLLPGNPNYAIFKIIFLILVASFVFKIWKDRQSFSWSHFFLACGFSAMGFLQLRNFALFGLFAIPIISSNFNEPDTAPAGPRDDKTWWAFTISLIALFLALSGELTPMFPALRDYRLGLLPNMIKSADFWKQNELRGPIFNNYDVGGYLIYTLYPKERVFVDNRPEAYPTKFFQETYIPMQESEEVWRDKSQAYNFNAIFFWYRDYTPWAQTFLQNRIKDPDWAPVFADNYVVIFLKRGEKNDKIISQFEIKQ